MYKVLCAEIRALANAIEATTEPKYALQKFTALQKLARKYERYLKGVEWENLNNQS